MRATYREYAPSPAALEILHRTFMLLRGCARLERTEISAPAGLWIGLARIEAVRARFQLANHRRPPRSACARAGGGMGAKRGTCRNCSFHRNTLIEAAPE